MFNPRGSAVVPPVSAAALFVRSVALAESGTLSFDAALLQFITALRMSMTAVRGRLFTPADGRSTLVVFIFCHAETCRKKRASTTCSWHATCDESRQVTMENRVKVALIAIVLAAACHRGGSTMQREQKQYQVVPEGQANGVSSTINAPGETAPPMTNTSADTTSNFTLAPNIDPTGTMPPGTIAGTLPATGPMTSASPQPMPQMPRPAAPPPRVAPQPAPRSQPQQQPQQPPQQQQPRPQPAPPPPPQTDTSTTTAPPPPQTDTTATEEQEPQQDPPPQPPPTQTDTRGW
jgi:hypothetical protein